MPQLRLNAKQLAYMCRGNADKSGYLFKRGAFMNVEYKKRWFVLRGNLLFYFKSKGSKDPTGLILVESCTIKREKQGQDMYYQFTIRCGAEDDREYQLATTTIGEMDEWIAAIESANLRQLTDKLNRLQLLLFKEEFCKGITSWPASAKLGTQTDTDGGDVAAAHGASGGSDTIQDLVRGAMPGDGFHAPNRQSCEVGVSDDVMMQYMSYGNGDSDDEAYANLRDVSDVSPALDMSDGHSPPPPGSQKPWIPANLTAPQKKSRTASLSTRPASKQPAPGRTAPQRTRSISVSSTGAPSK
eukprot:m.242189 g.242189  ORF g.242189 m.242189 type:complete len:299 (-) comp19437_c1_seq1:342-1238(-)